MHTDFLYTITVGSDGRVESIAIGYSFSDEHVAELVAAENAVTATLGGAQAHRVAS